MESPSPDPSTTPMAAAAEAEAEAEADPPRSPMDVSYQPELSKDQTDRKKNLYMVSEDNSIMSALPKEMTMRKKRNIRAGGCNVRKSLAWNQAFFTEEGVLDSVELSLLGRSSTKSSRNLQSVSEMSPLSAYNKSSIRPPLHDLGANICGQVHKKSENKVRNARKLFPSINEEDEAHAISGKMPSAKGLPRSIPRSPAIYSQKRVANVSTTNPTSKLLKFMPAKTHTASLPSTSSNVMLGTESSKSEHIVPKVNVGQGVGVKAVKNNSVYPSSSKLSAADYRRTISQLNNGSTNSKMIPKHLTSSKLNEAITSGTVKAASSTSLGINNVHGGPAPVHARPSALRMPSPSLGFFCQGKASPSYNNQSQRPTEHQPSESKIPSLRKPAYMRREGELRPLTSTGHQPTKSTAAIKSGSGVGISSSSVTFPTTASEKHSCVDESMEVKQADGKDKRAPVILGSFHCEKDGETDHNNDNHAKSVFSGKCNPDGFQEAPGSGRSLEASNNLFAEGIPQPVNLNIPEHVQDACPSTRGLLRSKVLCPNTSSEIGFARERKDNESKEIRGSDAGADNLSTQSLTGVKLNETYAIDCDAARNSDVSDQGYGFAARNIDCDAQLETKESFNQRTDQIPSVCLSRGIQLGNCSTQSSSKSLEAATPGKLCVTSGLNSALSEEFEPTFLQASEPEYGPKKGISPKEDVLTQGEKISTDKTKQGFPLGVVPFSDEWLAVVEAFGEDILEKKTGAVQNSPTDKASPEPGPWSPVKRKAQDIGPHDCTKYSKSTS